MVEGQWAAPSGTPGTPGAPGRLWLRLLDGFELRVDGRFVPVPAAVQRLLAFLALRRRPQHRSTVAGTLWLDTSDDHAARNLRSALWRARKLSTRLVSSSGSYLGLAPAVGVDVSEAASRAEQLLGSGGDRVGDDVVDLRETTPLRGLGGDLLPDWSDEWVLIERERLRQLRLHALEALCAQLTDSGRYAHAVEAGLAAIAVEPLRESAHRALVRTYLAEGNASEALRHYKSFRALLDDSMGVAPTAGLSDLVAHLRLTP
jgi:DNA-binding SARP family transcriptional activator